MANNAEQRVQQDWKIADMVEVYCDGVCAVAERQVDFLYYGGIEIAIHLGRFASCEHPLQFLWMRYGTPDSYKHHTILLQTREKRTGAPIPIWQFQIEEIFTRTRSAFDDEISATERIEVNAFIYEMLADACKERRWFGGRGRKEFWPERAKFSYKNECPDPKLFHGCRGSEWLIVPGGVPPYTSNYWGNMLPGFCAIP